MQYNLNIAHMVYVARAGYDAHMTNAAPHITHMDMQIAMATNVLAADGIAHDIAQDSLIKMMRGMQKYHSYNALSARAPLDEIWRRGEASLRCIPTHDYKRPPTHNRAIVVLVPSMVNKSDIFDLTPERSLLRWLAGQGVDPYILDWGDSAKDTGQGAINDVITHRLIPAIEYVHEHTRTPVSALGYCMGGTLLIGAAQVLPANVLRSLVLMATPWDFHAGSGALLNAVKFWAPTAAPILGTHNVIPATTLHQLFATLDPEAPLRKFTKFADMTAKGREHLFVATENWVNDGVDLPRGVAQTCIYDWFINNAPARGDWMLNGAPVYPDNITCPVMIMASKTDRLVEYDMAHAAATGLRDAAVHTPACGHIGMIAGRRAIADVWTRMKDWILQR